jgi:hypothetical protein
MIIFLNILSYIADKIIFFKVNIMHELIAEKNIAVGIIQCFIYIALGALLAQLTA